ncbi:transposable element Tcb2 transposase [Trichonephila clavipes]|nr:transposable element Tcb2 transposase [Trichonephila clavipes]
MSINDRKASSRQLAAHWYKDTCVLCQFVDVSCTVDCVHVCIYAGSPAQPTCVCNELMSTELGTLNDTKLSFQMNHASICGIMMAAFMLDAMPDKARSHVEKTVRDFCSAQHMQLLPWHAYLPDMSPIENVWDLVGGLLARDQRPAALKGEVLLRIQGI